MTVAEYLDRIEGLAEIARAEAPEADRARRLGDKTVQAIVDAGLHRALLPPSLGGGGITWAENFRLIEALARVDGAASWNTSIWAGTAQLAVTLADEAASAEVLGDGSSLCSASLNWLNLSATRVDDGYVIDGKATFLSGSSHAQWLSLGGWLRDDDGAPQFEHGAPHVIRGVVPMSAVPVEDTWHVTGLRATASNDAVVDRLFIADSFISDPRRGALLGDDPAFHIPIASRFGAPFAFVGLGIALGALDALIEVVADRGAMGSSMPLRERADVQIDVARARALVESGRAFLERTWSTMIDKVGRGERLTVEDQVLLRLSYVTAAENAASATDIAQRSAGSAGIYESGRIERCWRDAHVVPAHAMVSARNLSQVGRVLLGLEPRPGIL